MLFSHPGLTATPHGQAPTGTVAMTLLFVVSITEVVLLKKFATYTFFPSGLTATPVGLVPTSTVAVMLFVAVSITKRVLL